MSRRSIQTATLVAAIAAGCGRGDVAMRSLPGDVAVVHCTSSGRNLMPPILVRSPAPPPPSGLLARRMDPMALDDMGYERDRPICAGLIRAAAPRVTAAGAALGDLAALAYATGRSLRGKLGRCTCDVAYAAGMRAILPECSGSPTHAACTPTDADRATLDEAITPLLAAIDAIDLPRIHWRLAGRTDRPQWFADKLPDLIARHSGGSTVFRPGEPIPERDNHALVRRLFEVAGVVAVVRQDSGTAILVARVLDDAMILDHLSVPGPASRFAGLLEAIDNRRADDVVAALALPRDGWWTPMLDPSRGTLVEIDRAGLHAMDDLVIALSMLSARPYEPSRETWTTPTPLVDRVALLAPFGAEGLALDAELQLSDTGVVWAGALPDGRLSPDGSELDLFADPPRFVAAPGPETPVFFARGSAASHVALHGLSRAGALMKKIEMEYPGSLAGSTLESSLTLPQGSVGFGGALTPVEGTEAVADIIAQRPMQAKLTIARRRDRVHLQLRPK